MSSKLPLIVAMIALLIPAAAAQGDAVNDTFNRPNSSSLGPDWAEQTGNGIISSNQLKGNGFQGDLGWSLHTTFASASYVSQVMRADWSQIGGFDRIIFLAGASANWSGVSVKIGDNDGDAFADRVWFEAAMNAGSWYSQGSPIWFNLAPQVAAGTATVWFTNGGDTANVEIIRASDGSIQTYSASGILGSPFVPTGTSVGLGYTGQVLIDNFQAWVGSPTAPAYTMTQPRVGSSGALMVTGATPSSSVLMVYSLTGGGPIPSTLGNIGLDFPIYFLPVVPTDASGTATLPFPALPASLLGVTLYTQVLDVGSVSLSNYFASWVLSRGQDLCV